ncbi:TPR-like protein [Crassisporium funariophilum]|nr:TPR-like protein [Crassisporium funariophilum]
MSLDDNTLPSEDQIPPTSPQPIVPEDEDPGHLFALTYNLPDSNPSKPPQLRLCAHIALHRFYASGNAADVRNSIAAYKHAARLTQADDAVYFDYLADAGEFLRLRYLGQKRLPDLDCAISALEVLLEGRPEGDAEVPGWLDSLGVALRWRFERRGESKDIDDAISYQRKSVNLTPHDHTAKPNRLANLGDSFLRRFESLADLKNIDEAVSSHHGAVHLATGEHAADLPVWLNNLGTSFITRFERTGDPADVDHAIDAQQKAVNLTPEGHISLETRLRNLGTAFLRRFERKGDLADIDHAISAYSRALDLLADSNADTPVLLNCLGVSFVRRFEITGIAGDINEAISYQQKAVTLGSDDVVSMPSWLNTLGCSFLRRWECTGGLADLDSALSTFTRVFELASPAHAEMPFWLNNRAAALHRRFERTGDLADVKEAISIQQSVIDLAIDRHALYVPGWLNLLGTLFLSRYEHVGDIADVNGAIDVLRRVGKLQPESQVDLPGQWSGNLQASLVRRFEHTGDLVDINEAIPAQRRLVDATPDDHANMPAHLHTLGTLYLRRFERNGDLADIEEAITLHSRAVGLTFEGHANMPTRLNSLGNAYLRRFQHTGALTDINEAISAQQRAVNLTPDGHIELARWLSNLGTSYMVRFERTGEVADIQESVSAQRKAVGLIRDGHAEMHGHLNNLGCALMRCTESTGNLAVIDEAISTQKRAVGLIADDHADMPDWLSNIGTFFVARFQRTKELEDLNEAISSTQKAIDLAPAGNRHANMPRWLNSLGNSFLQRYESQRNLTDIEKAISAHQQAVDLTPDGHALKAGWLTSLGNSFVRRSGYTDEADLQAATSQYRLAATCTTGSPSLRIKAARKWGLLCHQLDPSQSLDAHRVAVGLIPLVAGMEQIIQRRHANLVDISDISTTAAAAAISLGEHATALEWLEQGRCLVWNQLNNLRTPLDELRVHDAGLANELLRVSRALESAGSKGGSVMYDASMSQRITLQDEVIAHVKLSKTWDELLGKVRKIPEFEGFLRPVQYSDLAKHVPQSGAIVVINVHQDRCDALALIRGADSPIHVPLSKFSYKLAENLRGRLNGYLSSHGVRMREAEPDTRGIRYAAESRGLGVIQEILAELWTRVVKPILDALAISLPHPDSDPSRIWWCATGPLAFLPIHAAGVYAPDTKGHRNILSDFAISSYTPTVTVLLERVKNPRKLDEQNNGLLIINQPNTPGLPSIPGTSTETRAIEQQLQAGGVRFKCLEGSGATVEQGMKEMETYSCIHLACHAIQDTREPLQSGFHLHDGRLELAEIIRHQLTGADFAFLSACETSTGTEKLSEEAVHLAAGMLAAGYRGVVATMWSIKDRYGPMVAEHFYANLFSRGTPKIDGSGGFIHGDGAALALHRAAKHARGTLGDSESSFLVWVPYVHFGL